MYEMLKRVLLLSMIFAIAIIILMTPEGECVAFFSHSLCTGKEKETLVKWIFVFDSLLLAYTALPVLHYLALASLIKHKNRHSNRF